MSLLSTTAGGGASALSVCADPEYPFALLPVREIDLLPEGFPTPALELEIDTHLPWVLPVSYED